MTRGSNTTPSQRGASALACGKSVTSCDGESTKGILLQSPVPWIDDLLRPSLTRQDFFSSGQGFREQILVEPRLVVAGHQMIKFLEIAHQSPIARKQVFQTAAFQMRPHRTMKQNVTAEKYPVNPIQKANVINRLAWRVNHFQIPATKIKPVTIAQPMIDVKRR